jgi:hypothetical protein
MKTKLKISLSLLFLWLAIGGCEPRFDSEKCGSENRFIVDVQNIDGFENCGILIGGSNKDRNLVIKSKNEFADQMNCNPEFAGVDFEKYFILAGSFTHKKCANIISKNTYICDGLLVFEVRIEESLCTAPTTVTYQTLIDRKYENLKIIFDIKLL